jgi:hypothetical protein
VVYIRKEHFRIGLYNKMNLKFEPFTIRREFRDSAYEVELLKEVDIFPIFIVAFLYE